MYRVIYVYKLPCRKTIIKSDKPISWFYVITLPDLYGLGAEQQDVQDTVAAVDHMARHQVEGHNQEQVVQVDHQELQREVPAVGVTFGDGDKGKAAAAAGFAVDGHMEVHLGAHPIMSI